MKTPFKEMTLARLKTAKAALEKGIEKHQAVNPKLAKRYSNDLNTVIYWINIREDERPDKNTRTKTETELAKNLSRLFKKPYTYNEFTEFCDKLRIHLQTK